MSGKVLFSLNKSSRKNISSHLLHCDSEFVPSLSCRVDIVNYSDKIFENAELFEAWGDGVLIGLVAAYCDGGLNKLCYISNVSVFKDWQGMGVAANLLDRCIEYAENKQFENIVLEVHENNNAAIELYKKKGFVAQGISERMIAMNLYVKGYK